MSSKEAKPISATVNFATAGLGGLFGWFMVHPFNTMGIRMNLASTSAPGAQSQSFTRALVTTVQKEGVLSLYSGLSAGLMRQLFYATSRFGLFEVFRDELAKYRETDFFSRLFCGVTSGGKKCLVLTLAITKYLSIHRYCCNYKLPL